MSKFPLPAEVRRHLLLCATPAKAKCCDPAVGAEAWDRLKKRVKEAGLDMGSKTPVLRTKVDCLRVCKDGPVLMVWPDGICYGHVTADAVDRIVDEHLVGERPVEDLIIGRSSWQPEEGGYETAESGGCGGGGGEGKSPCMSVPDW